MLVEVDGTTGTVQVLERAADRTVTETRGEVEA